MELVEVGKRCRPADEVAERCRPAVEVAKGCGPAEFLEVVVGHLNIKAWWMGDGPQQASPPMWALLNLLR